MKPEIIKALLLVEMEGKLTYTAYKAGPCCSCHETIAEGDEFVFMEGKQKLCNTCLGEIIEFLEE